MTHFEIGYTIIEYTLKRMLMTKRKIRQKDWVINYLERGKPLTKYAARKKYGIKSLSARVCELRKGGDWITTQMKRTPVSNGYKVGVYIV